MKKAMLCVLFTLSYFCSFPQTSIESYMLTGDSLMENKENKLAIEAYTSVIKLDPFNAQAYFKRGNAHFIRHENKDAMKDYNQAIKLDSTIADAFNNRGLLRYRLNNTEGGRLDMMYANKLKRNEGTIKNSLLETITEYRRVVEVDNLSKEEIYKGVKEWILKSFNEPASITETDDHSSAIFTIILKPYAVSNVSRIGFVIPYKMKITIKANKAKIELSEAHCYQNGKYPKDDKIDLGMLSNENPVQGFITKNKWNAIKEDVDGQFNRILNGFENIKLFKRADGF